MPAPSARLDQLEQEKEELRQLWRVFYTNYREWEKPGISTQQAQTHYDDWYRAMMKLNSLLK